MPLTSNSPINLYFETFGNPLDPTLIWIVGFGGQCLYAHEQLCTAIANEGFHVIRYDHRDSGLSEKCDGPGYSTLEMAGDAISILDHLGIEKSHVLGVSMGGYLAQIIAIHFPNRILSLTSVMSSTGEPDVGQPDPEARKVIMETFTLGDPTRESAIKNAVISAQTYGSRPEWIDVNAIEEFAGRLYDRDNSTVGQMRRYAAFQNDNDRVEGLKKLSVPTLVVHGNRDRLVNASGGRRTAEIIPDAQYIEIDGMGHDIQPAMWDQLITHWKSLVRDV